MKGVSLMKFGDNLKLIRKNKKMSQEQLAEKMNVSRQSVSKWETGGRMTHLTSGGRFWYHITRLQERWQSLVECT